MNYSPTVSLLSLVSKILERVVARQLKDHSPFAKVQSAFLVGHSTETALPKVLNDILNSMDNGDSVILALLDQSFFSVWYL